jgi:hypothetical protein
MPELLAMLIEEGFDVDLLTACSAMGLFLKAIRFTFCCHMF